MNACTGNPQEPAHSHIAPLHTSAAPVYAHIYMCTATVKTCMLKHTHICTQMIHVSVHHDDHASSYTAVTTSLLLCVCVNSMASLAALQIMQLRHEWICVFKQLYPYVFKQTLIQFDMANRTSLSAVPSLLSHMTNHVAWYHCSKLI